MLIGRVVRIWPEKCAWAIGGGVRWRDVSAVNDERNNSSVHGDS